MLYPRNRLHIELLQRGICLTDYNLTSAFARPIVPSIKNKTEIKPDTITGTCLLLRRWSQSLRAAPIRVNYDMQTSERWKALSSAGGDLCNFVDWSRNFGCFNISNFNFHAKCNVRHSFRRRCSPRADGTRMQHHINFHMVSTF